MDCIKEKSQTYSLVKSQDILNISFFLFVVGGINLINIMVKEIGLWLLGASVDRMTSIGFAIRYVDGASFIILMLFYIGYYYKIKKEKRNNVNDVLNIWGIVMIGEVILKVCFAVLLDALDNISINLNELKNIGNFYIMILFFLYLSIKIRDKKIIAISLICAFLQYILIVGKYSITIGAVHGNSVNVFAQDLFGAGVLSIGVILCVIYMRIHVYNRIMRDENAENYS